MDLISYKIATINTANVSTPTKIAALGSFIRASDLDIIFLQEIQNDQLCITGYNIIFNIDHQCRGTAIAIRNQYSVDHVERSLDSRILMIKISSVTFINIYAPSGAAQRNARETFFNENVAHYLHQASRFVVLGGDFNCVVNTKDATGTNSLSPMCKRLVTAAQLVDSWEVLNGSRVEFSYVRSNAASRIDRLLVSKDSSPQLRSAHFSVTSFSDHKAYVLRLVLPNLGTSVGRGIWKLQPHVLDDPDVLAEFSRKWTYWIRSRGNFRSWIEWWISYVKPKLTSFLKWKTSIYNREFNDTIELYRNGLRIAYDNYLGNPDQITVINRIKAQMLQKQRDFTANQRRMNETFLSGESTTVFQVADKFGKRAKSTINSLELEDGSTESDSTTINNVIRNFFEQLYTSTDVVIPQDRFLPLKQIPQQQPENENLMRPILEEELLAAIKNSSPKKSPGADGLPKEFFLKTWRIISAEFTNVINDALQGRADKTFFDGIVVLVKKKGDDKTIKGYRPISLLNVDYKLLARILKQRLHALLPLVLSSNQKCSNGKKSIFEATTSILDRICELKHRRGNSLLVSFDLDHAFDRVNHEFLRTTLLRMNFNGAFVNLLTSIWSKSFSRILINGRLSEEFKIRCSVRQGDPLSMHLFVVYLQPLLDEFLRSNPDHLFNAYADDISMFFENEHILLQVVEIFEEFGFASGALLNRRKTAAIVIGDVNLTEVSEWLSIEDNIKILGIYFGNDIKRTQKKNWETVINGLRTRLWMHKPRKLNIIQKVILINTYISSKIWYMASNIAISKGFVKKIKTELGKFIWYGQPLQRIAFSTLILPKSRGGLNLHCPDLKSKALLSNRLMKLETHLPFLSSLLRDSRSSIPSLFSHAITLKNEIAKMPDALRNAPSSQSIYQNLISLQPDPGFVSAQSRDWKTVFKNIHYKALSSDQRSSWYVVAHKKIKHRELYFNRRVLDNPNCLLCVDQPESVVHKLFRCQRVFPIWRLQRRLITNIEFSLRNLEPEDFIYPNFRHVGRNSKHSILLTLATFFQYHRIYTEEEISVEHYNFYLYTQTL